MASNKKPTNKFSREQRSLRIRQVLFAGFAIMIILSMIISSIL
jgi:hypothetical protein